ncbi:hypothetical protein H4R35_000137 [Dimargaris xerosporica]|nr:hypothetical protein H4R35_000137 [Dimargaris xerosporica]
MATLASPPHDEADPIPLSSLDYVGTVNANLVCCICQAPFVDPALLPCGHIYCSACVTAVAAEASAHCPLDRQPFTAKAIKSAPVAIHNLVDELLVYCPSRPQGCLDHPQRQTLGTHLATQCQFAKVKCHHAPCQDITVRKYADQHARACPWGSSTCPQCPAAASAGPSPTMPTAAVPTDNQATSDAVSRCKFCSATCETTDLVEHQQHCTARAVACQHSAYGCPWTGSSVDDLDAHLNADCLYHKLRGLIAFQDQRYKNLQRQQLESQRALEHVQSTMDAAQSREPSSNFGLLPQFIAPNQNPLATWPEASPGLAPTSTTAAWPSATPSSALSLPSLNGYHPLDGSTAHDLSAPPPIVVRSEPGPWALLPLGPDMAPTMHVSDEPLDTRWDTVLMELGRIDQRMSALASWMGRLDRRVELATCQLQDQSDTIEQVQQLQDLSQSTRTQVAGLTKAVHKLNVRLGAMERHSAVLPTSQSPLSARPSARAHRQAAAVSPNLPSVPPAAGADRYHARL